jgi:hypothetical protein
VSGFGRAARPRFSKRSVLLLVGVALVAGLDSSPGTAAEEERLGGWRFVDSTVGELRA